MKEYEKIDLHLHTNASDGTDTPEELLEKVTAAGFDLFSVTDHDTIKCAGLMPGLIAAAAGKGAKRPDLITGVEFSCRIGNGDDAEKYHILAYGYDPGDEGLAALLAKGRGFRMEKALKRLDYLRDEYGFTFPQEEVDAFLAMNSPAKPHLALMMVRNGYASDIDDAVENYIDKRQFENVNLLPDETIKGIIAAGGIPVLAHPPFGDGKDRLSGKKLEERIAKLVGYGLQGLEGYYSKYDGRQRAEVLGLADRYGLYVTAGSDYHGKNKSVPLGFTNLPDASEWPEGLRRFLRDVRKI